MTLGRSNDKQSLARRIDQLVTENPAISQRRIAVVVRGEGFKAANETIRGLTRIRKATGGGVTQVLNVQEGLTLGQRFRGGKEVIRQAETYIKALGGREVARDAAKALKGQITDTYVAIEWEATAIVDIKQQGRLIETQEYKAKGRIVQPLQDYTIDLVQQRILQQFQGQIFSQRTSGASSWIEGLELDVKPLRFDKLEVEVRRGR